MSKWLQVQAVLETVSARSTRTLHPFRDRNLIIPTTRTIQAFRHEVFHAVFPEQ